MSISEWQAAKMICASPTLFAKDQQRAARPVALAGGRRHADSRRVVREPIVLAR